jgi:hypothetical protein
VVEPVGRPGDMAGCYCERFKWPRGIPAGRIQSAQPDALVQNGSWAYFASNFYLHRAMPPNGFHPVT